MILIADSGSTKTEWRLSDDTLLGENTCITKGINPFYQNTKDILNSLNSEFKLTTTHIDAIHFYGAGCANAEKNNVVKKALSTYFKTDSISIESDLVGAARSLCGHSSGIACILGTGSNSCVYDGEYIIDNTSPLGYIIGDEGSGSALGKQLVSDILKKQLPQHIINLFYDEYDTEKNEILDNIYKKPFANRYLASFTTFLSKHIELPELSKIVIESFEAFIKRNLLQYKDVLHLKINFTGSVAFYFQDQLKQALSNYNLNLGFITQTPMDGLEKYHNLNK